MGEIFFLLAHGGLGVIALPLLAFSIWMLVDCANNRRDYYWYWIILGFWGIGALIYFFTFKWDTFCRESVLFSWLRNRQTADEVRARVRHLDNAACYEDLGDSYWRLNKLAEAEAAYKKALERDAASLDIRAKFAHLLVTQNRAEEAWPMIEEVLRKQRDYETDEILRQAAQCQAGLGNYTRAEEFYLEFLNKHSYFEAHIEYGEFLLKSGRVEEGRAQLEEVILDIRTSPRYVRRRNWRESLRAHWLLFRYKRTGQSAAPEEDEAKPDTDPVSAPERE
jgi:hypothetical protein